MTMQDKPGDYREPGVGQHLANWGAQRAGEEARTYAVGKAAQWASRTGIGSKVFIVTRWLWLADWGLLAATVLLALLGIIGIAQKDTFLGVLVLVIAAMVFGIWFVVRRVRRFIDRQVERAFAKFMELVNRGVANMNDWPRWYRQHRRERF
ncbi:MAG TPA: hypothetical protein VH186_00905 [Chloroflexia bacterium]|nr:hypothetical protein [Chloroflexia bacterium]